MDTQNQKVSSFTLMANSQDGCIRETRYLVKEGKVREVTGAQWHPMEPRRPLAGATLTTHYQSGRALTIEIDGDEHGALSEQGRLDKLLRKVVGGQMPGEALKRQLTRAMDLSPLPKIKTPRLR